MRACASNASAATTEATTSASARPAAARDIPRARAHPRILIHPAPSHVESITPSPLGARLRLSTQGRPQTLDVAALSLGKDHSCARLRDGEVACWGSNEFGQLGDGGRMISARPLEVQL